MAAYRTEEEQLEALRRWWRENGKSTIAALVLALAAGFGWQGWQRHRGERAEAASALYQDLLALDSASAEREEREEREEGGEEGEEGPDEEREEGEEREEDEEGEERPDEEREEGEESEEDEEREEGPGEERASAIRDLAGSLKDGYAGGSYAQFAALRLAKLAVDEGDLEAAAAELRWVLMRDPPEEIQRVARLRLARVVAAQGEGEAALDMLAEPAGAYEAVYAEARGDIHLQLEQRALALDAYREADGHNRRNEVENSPALDLKLQSLQLEPARSLSGEAATEADDAQSDDAQSDDAQGDDAQGDDAQSDDAQS